MTNDNIPGLGPITEAPKLNPKVSMGDVTLSPEEGFVLSRVDGQTSLGDICKIAGLGEKTTVRILQKLKASLVIVTSAPMSDLPPDLAPPSVSRRAAVGSAPRRNGPSAAAAPGRAGPTGASAAPAPGANAATTGGAATRPVPPLPDHEIEPALLLEGPDLEVEKKKRILAFHRRLAHLDHFQRLEIFEDADRQTVRRAFFRLSKEFHPDRYYGKDLGHYREWASDVFKAISSAFSVLSRDDQRREYEARLRASRRR